MQIFKKLLFLTKNFPIIKFQNAGAVRNVSIHGVGFVEFQNKIRIKREDL